MRPGITPRCSGLATLAAELCRYTKQGGNQGCAKGAVNPRRRCLRTRSASSRNAAPRGTRQVMADAPGMGNASGEGTTANGPASATYNTSLQRTRCARR